MWNWSSFICGDYNKQLHLVIFLNEFGLNFVVPEQVPVYISEITPKNLRGGFATVNQVCTELNQIRLLY